VEALAEELTHLGLTAKAGKGGVRLTGGLAEAYQAAYQSRLASRLLLPLVTVEAGTPDELHKALTQFNWGEHIKAQTSFAIEAKTQGENRHSHFVALRVKDALRDFFNAKKTRPPQPAPEDPEITFHLYWIGDQAELSLDFTGSLFMRGYRPPDAQAPLKENLAALLLYKCRWPELAAQGKPLVDPFCGSGTICLEGAMMAAQIPAGSLKRQWGFTHWPGHDPALWAKVKAEADARRVPLAVKIWGRDESQRAIEQAIAAARRLGLEKELDFDQAMAERLDLPRQPGLILTNPPYGKRIGEDDDLAQMHRDFGEALRAKAIGWELGLFTAKPEFARELGIRAHRTHDLYNGPLEAKLLRFQIEPSRFWGQDAPKKEQEISEEAQECFNRILKNQKKLKGWLKQEGVTCYRLYDRDLPNYAFSVDVYEDHLLLAEYEPPKEIDPAHAARRAREMVQGLPGLLGLPPEKLIVKLRKSQKGKSQYEAQTQSKTLIAQEAGMRFELELLAYLDVGLFLDGRNLRQWIKQQARGKRFLNLFAYTCTATVAAALGGAKSTVSVDLSHTYLDWGRQNFKLNQIPFAGHEFMKADCLQWLTQAKGTWDLILLDPPSFSNSKSMEQDLDIQKDHGSLIQQTCRLLAPGGMLVFMTNKQRFKLDAASLTGLQVEPFTATTLPPDFSRGKIHQSWLIRKG